MAGKLARLLVPILVVASGASVAAEAQLAAKGGLVSATLSESPTSPDWKPQLGFAAGVAMRIRSPLPMVGLQPELLFVEKGAKEANADTENRIGYIDIPLLLRISTPGPGTGLFAVAGPAVSWRVFCSRGILNCTGLYHPADYGVHAGAGVRVGSTPGWSIEARYAHGLRNINARNQDYESRTRAVMVLVGLAY